MNIHTFKQTNITPISDSLMQICHAGQFYTSATGQMSRPAADKDYSTCIHSFLQDYVLMESTNHDPPPPSPTGPVLHRWLVGFYLSNLFSFIPSLGLLFSFLKPTVNEYDELDKSALKRLLGSSVFCPSFSFIVSSLSPTPC